jgi:peroxiredoxin Q/BCP
LRDNQHILDQAGVKAWAVSYDSAESHAAFRAKYGLSTPFLVDTDRKIGIAYGQPAEGYPKRKTFVIAKDGRIAAVIDPVDLADHANQIVNALTAKPSQA